MPLSDPPRRCGPVATPLAALTGVAMVLAFPLFGDRYHLDHLIWVTLVPLFIAARGVGARRGFALGWVAGMTLEVGGFCWILHAIRTFGTAHAVVSSVLFLAWLLWESVPWGVLGLALGRCRSSRQVLWVLPLWVGVEHFWPRLWPWHMGGALYAQPWFLQCVDLLGASGLTALVFLVSAAVAALVERRRGERWPWGRLVAAVLLLFAALGYGRWRLQDLESWEAERPRLVAGFVQGCLRPDQRGAEFYTRATEELLASTEELPDIVLWPEGADSGRPFDRTPGYSPWTFHLRDGSTPRDPDYWILGRFPVPLLFGSAAILHDEQPRDGGFEVREAYNVAVYLQPDGNLAFYEKNRPVPFGEMVPGLEHLPESWRREFRQMFPFVGNLDLGDDNPEMELEGHRFKNLICYEAVLPGYVREASRDVDFLVNITEDYWYGRTAHIPQHRSVLILRAVECRVPVLRVTNVGPSGVVDVTGAFRGPETVFEPVSFRREFAPGSPGSLYRRGGHFFPLAALVLGLVLQAVLGRSPRRDSPSTGPEAASPDSAPPDAPRP